MNAYNVNSNACQIETLVFCVFSLQFVLSDLTEFVTMEKNFGGVEYRPKTIYELTAGVILQKRSLPRVH